MSTSIRNRLPGTIEKIVSDKVVSEIAIRTAAGIATSIITIGFLKRMNLKEGDTVCHNEGDCSGGRKRTAAGSALSLRAGVRRSAMIDESAQVD